MKHFRKLILLFPSLIFLTNFSFSQTKLINGQVVIHNSRTDHGQVEFAKKVKISSPLSSPVYSDGKGRFKLKLKGVRDDEKMFVTIEKLGHEVVNHHDIRNFLLDKKSKLRVSLAETGYTKRLMNKLEICAKKGYEKEKGDLLELLSFGGKAGSSVVQALEKRTGRELNTTSEAERLIHSASKDIEERFRFCAYELTVINHDFASDIFLSAWNLYKQSDLEATVTTLQKEDLDKSMNVTLAMIEKVKGIPAQVDRVVEDRSRILNQIKNNYTLQIIALQQSFRFKEAHDAIKKLEKVNAISPDQRYRKLVEELDFFKVVEPLETDENIVLENKSPVAERNEIVDVPIHSPRKANVPTQRVDHNSTPAEYKTQLKRLTINDVSERVMKQSSSSHIAKPASKANYPKKNNNTPTVVHQVVDKRNDTSTPLNINTVNETQPSASYQLPNEENTVITITTTITTSSKGDIQVNSNSDQPMQQVVHVAPKKVIKAAALPNQRRYQVVRKVKKKNMDDFESIIFTSKGTSEQFRSFVKKEKEGKK